jgi:uncharacterized NAD(P)/FAD-binding protein YdhS
LTPTRRAQYSVPSSDDFVVEAGTAGYAVVNETNPGIIKSIHTKIQNIFLLIVYHPEIYL